MDTKTFSGRVELKADAQGEFTALIATFNKPDKYHDILRPGAFAATIADRRARHQNVPVVFAHQSQDITQHVGHVAPEDLEETSVGLQARGRFYLEEPIAAKVFKQLQRKALGEWSFGFIIDQAKALANGYRELLAVQLLELGPVLAGAGETATIDVKSHMDRADALDPYRARIEQAERRFAIARAQV